MQSGVGIDKRVFGLVVALGAESMLFAGLTSAHLILRGSVEGWPPADQPRLPIEMTALATLALLASGVTVWRATVCAREGSTPRLLRWLGLTTLLGVAFLSIQGVEWIRLIAQGLTLRSSLYGALFYAVIGFHALHVVVGVLALAYLLSRSGTGRYSSGEPIPVVLGAVYWCYVVGLWPLLYALVYLL
ncbi:heme-copper oxidase subunit III [Candidatus Poribacteria bacterium]|nr:heme-copper oxidase subunit III [Candidatus Poribacteria bacterium]